MRTKRTISILTAAAILAGIPLTAFAAEREATSADTEHRRVQSTEANSEVFTDPPAVDRPATRPTTDRPDSPRPKLDRCDPRLVDNHRRCLHDDDTDVRPIHQCFRLADNPRRCLHIDDSDPINVRHLIWRLINAHEWELLHRLLHWLVA